MIGTLAALLFSVLLHGEAVVAAPPIAQVRLALDDSSVLPGTPTGVSVTVTNQGDAPLRLPALLWVISTNAAGKKFVLRALPTTNGVATTVPEELRAIPAGESRELRFDPVVFIFGSPWLIDERLIPGEYHLRAVLAAEIKRDGTFDPRTALVSKEEALTVSVPSDEDAAVWQWMQSTGGGTWGQREWSKHYQEFGTYVMGSHPRSQYALFAAVFQPHKHGEVPAHLEEQIQRYPGKAFCDQMKLLLVQIHQQGISNARLQSDMYHAAEEFDTARGLAIELMQNSRSSLVRASAKELFGRTPTREQLLKKPEVR
jgi:hypothetical protein